MKIILLCFFIAILFNIIIFSVLYPISLKRKIVNINEVYNVPDNSYYIFKISVIGYLMAISAGLLMGFIFAVIPCYFLLKSSNHSFGEYIFIGIIIFIGVISFLGYAAKVIYLYPRTFIEYENGIIKYCNGKKEVNFKLKDIISIEFEEYYRSFFWYIKVRIKEFKEKLPMHILAFENPEKIYSILNSRNISHS